MENEGIAALVQNLQKLDNASGYRLSYKAGKKQLDPITSQLILIGEPAIDFLHPLLKRQETWSCLCALEALKVIKSEKSVPFLIDYLIANHDEDYFESGEEAMFALQHIGKPAVEPLLKAVKGQFSLQKYVIYLVASLNEIKDERVFSYMDEVVRDFIAHPEKYDGWFPIDHFVYGFDIQGNKNILPLLHQIMDLFKLTEHEEIELLSTIEKMEDPKGHEEKMRRLISSFDGENRQGSSKIGRNDKCWCGSEMKYKKCCLKKDEQELGRARKHSEVPD